MKDTLNLNFDILVKNVMFLLINALGKMDLLYIKYYSFHEDLVLGSISKPNKTQSSIHKYKVFLEEETTTSLQEGDSLASQAPKLKQTYHLKQYSLVAPKTNNKLFE